MKKVFIYGGTLIVALALIVWKLNANKKSDAARIEVVRESSSGAVPVQILAVKSSNVDLSFDENGNFEAVNQIELTAEIAGRVSELYVKEGSVVKAGQAIAKIENEILNANQTEAKARLEQLRLNLNRYEQAYKTGGVTQKQVDDARLELESAHDQGDAGGQWLVGLSYLYGDGVPKDLAKAREWLEKAAAQKHPEAQAQLEKLKTP